MILRAFKSALSRRPLLTQMVASGAISASGDVVSQFVFEKRNMESFDALRTGRFFLLSSCFIAPCLSRWFILLEKIRAGNPKLIPLKRLIVDQTTFSPLFNGLILLNLRLLEGFGPSQSFEMMKKDWPTIYSSSLMVWPLVQLCNFYLVPLNMRVIVIQMVAFFWNSYLSFKTQSKIEAVVA